MKMFSYIHTLSSSTAKEKVVIAGSFPQQIRPQTTVQLGVLQECTSVRIGFSMNHKRHTLPIVYTMLV